MKITTDDARLLLDIIPIICANKDISPQRKKRLIEFGKRLMPAYEQALFDAERETPVHVKPIDTDK